MPTCSLACILLAQGSLRKRSLVAKSENDSRLWRRAVAGIPLELAHICTCSSGLIRSLPVIRFEPTMRFCIGPQSKSHVFVAKYFLEPCCVTLLEDRSQDESVFLLPYHTLMHAVRCQNSKPLCSRKASIVVHCTKRTCTAPRPVLTLTRNDLLADFTKSFDTLSKVIPVLERSPFSPRLYCPVDASVNSTAL